MHSPTIAGPAERLYVSTGHLPRSDMVQRLVSERLSSEPCAHFKFNSDGPNSQIYPALARALRDLFGICIVSTGGRICATGDVDHEFSITSGSKPFLSRSGQFRASPIAQEGYPRLAAKGDCNEHPDRSRL